MQDKVLIPRTSIRNLQLWNGYYLRWNPRMAPQVGLVVINYLNRSPGVVFGTCFIVVLCIVGK